jgi:hypothetical protein
MSFHILNVLYSYINTFQNMCAVSNMAVFPRSLISCFPGMLLRNFLNDFQMLPVPLIIIGITFTFHMRCYFCYKYDYLLLLLLLLLLYFCEKFITYRVADKSLAWPTSPWILFDD